MALYDAWLFNMGSGPLFLISLLFLSGVALGSAALLSAIFESGEAPEIPVGPVLPPGPSNVYRQAGLHMTRRRLAIGWVPQPEDAWPIAYVRDGESGVAEALFAMAVALGWIRQTNLGLMVSVRGEPRDPLATIAAVVPDVGVIIETLCDAPELAHAHASFFDARCFATKKGDVTKKYRRTIATARGKVVEEGGAAVVRVAQVVRVDRVTGPASTSPVPAPRSAFTSFSSGSSSRSPPINAVSPVPARSPRRRRPPRCHVSARCSPSCAAYRPPRSRTTRASRSPRSTRGATRSCRAAWRSSADSQRRVGQMTSTPPAFLQKSWSATGPVDWK